MAQGAARPMRQPQLRKAVSFEGAQARGHSSSIDDEATIAYIKRVLCAKPTDSVSTTDSPDSNQTSEPLEHFLPPLTSSNEVDIQLYALIAVILDLFVRAWYNRITPDHEFVASVVQIIAHCTRALEQRLRHVDLECLILHELPKLLAEHVDAIRISQALDSTRLTAADVRLRYHALRPHVALNPIPVDDDSAGKQQESEVAWCLLLVNRVLALLLPPEDLQNPCLDVLVSEILAELIFRNGVCGKACEPWLLWDGITKLLRTLQPKAGNEIQESAARHSQLDVYGLMAAAPASKLKREDARPRQRLEMITRTFWSLIQSLMTIGLLLRSVTMALMHASSTHERPTRYPHLSDGSTAAPVRSPPALTKGQASNIDGAKPQPIISMYIWSCVSELLMLRQRMPWLSGFLSLLQWIVLSGPGQLCCTNSRLDRILSSHVHERLLSARWIPSVLHAARTALFPDHVLAPARIPPTSDETVQIKRECAATIVEMVPGLVRTRFFATDDSDLMRDDVESDLDLLRDSYLNQHLIVRVVELIVARLFPELAAGGDEHAGARRASVSG